MNTQLPSPKANSPTFNMTSVTSLSFIHLLHGYRLCYPILCDISRDTFSDVDTIHRLCESLNKLQNFDFQTESSHGLSIDQKICAVAVATAVMEEILFSSDLVDAFHDANDTVQNWMEHANLLKPGMILPPYMPLIINPPFRRQALGRDDVCLVFSVPASPDWISEESAFESEPDEKETGSEKGTRGGLVKELKDSLRHVKLGRQVKAKGHFKQ